MTKMRRLSAVLILTMTVFPPSAFSDHDTGLQAGSLSPAEESASVLEKKIKEEPEAPAEKKEPKVEIEKKEVEEARIPELKFYVREIQLEGNTKIKTKELRPLLEPYEKKEWILEDLKQLAKAITLNYHARGFITSLAYIPPQQVKEGAVTIRVIEGKLEDVLVEGARFSRKNRILAYVRLKPGEVLEAGKLKSALQRISWNPGREASAVLRAGQARETSDVVIQIKDRFPLHGGFRWDNQGLPSSGRQRFGFTLTDDNLTGFDDIAQAGAVFGKEFGFIHSEYQLPIPETRTVLKGGFIHGQVTPKKQLKPFGVNSLSQTYSGKINQELYQSGRISLDLEAGLEVKESRTRVLAGTFRRERLRILAFGPIAAVKDPWGTTSLQNLFSFGLSGFGAGIHADPDASRQGVKPGFFRWRGNLIRSQKMPLGAKSIWQVEFQHPSRKLPSQQALYLGGANSIRGYPEGDYLADSGIRASVEYLHPFFLIPADWQLPYSDLPLRKQIEFVGFVDQGYGRLRGPSRSEARTRYLLGAGGGLRIQLYKHIYARTELAFALGNDPLNESNRHAFHFRLQVEQ